MGTPNEPDAAPRTVSRRRALTVVGGLAAGAVLAPDALWRAAGAASTWRGKPNPPSDADRAVVAYQAMQRYLYTQTTSGLYWETSPRVSPPYATLWPFTHALQATVDLYGIGRVGVADVRDRWQRGLLRYWDPAGPTPGYASYPVWPYGLGGDRYYDDSAWAGLALVRAHRLTGDAAALTQARSAFAFVASGWDTTATVAPGGVRWVEATGPVDRNTCSTAPAAQLAFRLHELTPGDTAYLPWALRAYRWVRTTLLDPATGLYADKIRADGTIDPTVWSYNQGSMVGAGVLAHRAEPGTGHLAEAEATARAALDRFTGATLDSQLPSFNSVLFRNLLMLRGATRDGALRQRIQDAAQSYADRLWATNRRTTGLFAFPTAAASPVELIHQGGVIELHADLAWTGAADLLV